MFIWTLSMSSYRALEREINIIRVIKSVRNEVHLGNVLSLERFLRFGSVSSSPISHSQKRKGHNWRMGLVIRIWLSKASKGCDSRHQHEALSREAG